MTAELKQEVLQCCNEINQKCQIQLENFQFENLRTREWYLAILQILFPHMEDKIIQINQMHGQAKAINKIVAQINELDQFQALTIDGAKIAMGDINQISNLVQVIFALLEIAIQQSQENQIEQKHNQIQNIQAPNNNNSNFQQQNKIQKKSISDYGKPKSVQAILNEFNNSDEEQQNSQSKDINIHKGVIKGVGKPVIQSIKVKQKKPQFKQSNKKLVQTKSNQNQDQIYIKTTQKIKQKNKIKNPQNNKLLFGSQPKKKLVTHPKSPQTLKKAKSSDAIQLTKNIEQNIKRTLKKNKKKKQQNRKLTSPIKEKMDRKKQQYQYALRTHQKYKNIAQAGKLRKKDHSEKNEQNLQKLLNFRQQKIKKQRREYEQSIKMKIQNQKLGYIKKINKLILQLQKDKQIQEKRDFKQELIKDNQAAVKKLVSLQQWYKNKLNLLKQNRRTKNQQRVMLKSGHKQIIKKIQKQMKKQNEQKLIQLTNMYRNQQNNIQTDFQELKQKIIQAYKRN